MTQHAGSHRGSAEHDSRDHSAKAAGKGQGSCARRGAALTRQCVGVGAGDPAKWARLFSAVPEVGVAGEGTPDAVMSDDAMTTHCSRIAAERRKTGRSRIAFGRAHEGGDHSGRQPGGTTAWRRRDLNARRVLGAARVGRQRIRAGALAVRSSLAKLNGDTLGTRRQDRVRRASIPAVSASGCKAGPFAA